MSEEKLSKHPTSNYGLLDQSVNLLLKPGTFYINQVFTKSQMNK